MLGGLGAGGSACSAITGSHLTTSSTLRLAAAGADLSVAGVLSELTALHTTLGMVLGTMRPQYEKQKKQKRLQCSSFTRQMEGEGEEDHHDDIHDIVAGLHFSTNDNNTEHTEAE